MAFKPVDLSDRKLTTHVNEPTLIKLAHDGLTGEPVNVSFTNFNMLTCVSLQHGKLSVACNMFALHADLIQEPSSLPFVDVNGFLVVHDLFLLGDFDAYLGATQIHEQPNTYYKLGDLVLLPNAIKGRVFRIAYDTAVRLTLAVEVKPQIHVLVDVPHELAHHRVTK